MIRNMPLSDTSHFLTSLITDTPNVEEFHDHANSTKSLRSIPAVLIDIFAQYVKECTDALWISLCNDSILKERQDVLSIFRQYVIPVRYPQRSAKSDNKTCVYFVLLYIRTPHTALYLSFYEV